MMATAERCATVLLMALLVLTGCASRAYKPDSSVPLYVPLPPALAGQIKAPDILVGVGQNTLMLGDQGKLWKPPLAPVENAPASGDNNKRSWHGRGGGSFSLPSGEAGLVVLLVVATVVLTIWSAQQGYEEYSYYVADRAVAPVRSSLQTYSFGDQLRAALDDHGRATLRLSDGQVSLVTPATQEHLTTQLKASNADSTMLVSLNYMMSPDLKRLQVVAEARLFPKSPALQEAHQARQRNRVSQQGQATDPANALYRRIVYFNSHLPADTANRDQAAQAWTQHDGQHIRAALNMGASTIAQILMDDLQLPADRAWRNRHVRIGGTLVDVLSDERGVLHVTAPPVAAPQASAGTSP